MQNRIKQFLALAAAASLAFGVLCTLNVRGVDDVDSYIISELVDQINAALDELEDGTAADAEDYIVLVAVSANRWLIQANTGFAASGP